MLSNSLTNSAVGQIQDINVLFNTAVRHHQNAELSEAEALYRRILSLDSNHVSSFYNLGLIANQVGQREMALKLFSSIS